MPKRHDIEGSHGTTLLPPITETSCPLDLKHPDYRLPIWMRHAAPARLCSPRFSLLMTKRRRNRYHSIDGSSAVTVSYVGNVWQYVHLDLLLRKSFLTLFCSKIRGLHPTVCISRSFT